MKISSKCNICTNRLINYKTHLKCSLCFQFSHPKCNFLSKTEAEQLHQSSDWTCYNCNRETFPLINDHLKNLHMIIIIIQPNATPALRFWENNFQNVVLVETKYITDANLIILDVRGAEMTYSLNHAISFQMELIT